VLFLKLCSLIKITPNVWAGFHFSPIQTYKQQYQNFQKLHLAFKKMPPSPLKCSFLLKSLSCNISLHYRVLPVPTGGWPPLHSRLLQVHVELWFGLKMNGIPDRWTAKHGCHCSGQRDDSGEDPQDQVQSGWTALSAAPYLK